MWSFSKMMKFWFAWSKQYQERDNHAFNHFVAHAGAPPRRERLKCSNENLSLSLTLWSSPKLVVWALLYCNLLGRPLPPYPRLCNLWTAPNGYRAAVTCCSFFVPSPSVSSLLRSSRTSCDSQNWNPSHWGPVASLIRHMWKSNQHDLNTTTSAKFLNMYVCTVKDLPLAQ